MTKNNITVVIYETGSNLIVMSVRYTALHLKHLRLIYCDKQKQCAGLKVALNIISFFPTAEPYFKQLCHPGFSY